jgi:hypothetical protein
MDGGVKTSIPDVITRGLLSLCLRSRTAMLLEAIPLVSGNLMMLVSMLVIVMRCCSTCLANVTSPTKEQEKRYTATHQWDLDMVMGSY